MVSSNHAAADNEQFYIAGESYAGQHIPHIARAILKRNKNQEYASGRSRACSLEMAGYRLSTNISHTSHLHTRTA